MSSNRVGHPGTTQLQPQERPTSHYIPGLDAIRAIAFLMVFCAHSLPRVSYYIPATLGVTIFFFLSGYLITTLLRKEIERTGTVSLRSFYIRRTLRIFIPLYVVYTLAVLLSRFVLHVGSGNLFGFFSMLFYFYNYAIAVDAHAWLPFGMSVIWSLSVEEHFYLLFPLVLMLMMRGRLGLRRITGILVGFCALELIWRFVLIAVIREHNLWTYCATDARLDSILWGCILALRNNPVLGDRTILPGAGQGRLQPLVFLAAVLMLIATLVPRDRLFKESLRYTVQALALYVIFSFVIARIDHWSVAWLEWWPLRYLGWISYILYLSHAFIVYVIVERFPNQQWVSAPIAFLISVLFATLMRYTLELPLQKLRARFRRGAPGSPSVPSAQDLVLETPHVR